MAKEETQKTYECPRCGGEVDRGNKDDTASAWFDIELIGLIFSSFYCENCGKIPKSEFPEKVQHKMNRKTGLLILFGIAIIVAIFLFYNKYGTY